MTYIVVEEELPMSNSGQLQLLSTMMTHGVRLRMTARGSSMTPFIRDRDIVTLAPIGDAGPVTGDIVAYSSDDFRRLTIHRVVRRNASGALVRGDRCSVADGIVDSWRILAKVVAVERDGRMVRMGIDFGARGIAGLSRLGVLAILKRAERAAHSVAKGRLGARRGRSNL